MKKHVAVVFSRCALVVAGVVGTVLARQPDAEPAKTKHISNVAGGRVPGLVILDDSYKHWAVAPVHLEATPGDDVVDVVFDTSDCERSGAVGYRLTETAKKVQVVVVSGESGNCFATVNPHAATIQLAARLGDRQLVGVQPNNSFR